jgi:hypothetical protein
MNEAVTWLRSFHGRRFATVLLCAAAIVGLSPSVAAAALPLTFDTFPNGTPVPNLTTLTTQYAPDGITFIDTPIPGTGVVPTGLPWVVNVGSRANSTPNVAESTCPGCEVTPQVLAARLSTTRATVSMRVGVDTIPSLPPPFTVKLEARDSSGAVVASTTANVTTDFKTPMSVASPSSADIAYFDLIAGQPPVSSFPIGIDDVTYSGGGSTPDLTVAPERATTAVTIGSSADLPIDVSRLNGSAGDVQMTASGLPPGASASFSPNPLPNSVERTIMHITESRDLFALGPVTVTVTATPIGALAGPAPRSTQVNLDIQGPYSFDLQDTNVSVSPCGVVKEALGVRRAAGFSDPITVSLTSPGTRYSATLDRTELQPAPDGDPDQEVYLTIRAVGQGAAPDVPLTVTASSGTWPTAAQTFTLHQVAGILTAFSPDQGYEPQDLHPGDRVTLRGQGLCPGIGVTFGDPNSPPTNEVFPGPGAFGPDGTSATVTVPRHATSGPITVRTPSGPAFASATTFTVMSFRSRSAFALHNWPGNKIGLTEVHNLYGAQANLHVDLCWPFGCDVDTGIPDPMTLVYLALYNANVPGNGMCYGIALTDQQMLSGQLPINAFKPSASVPFDYGSSAVTGTPAEPGLAEYISTWHQAQFSSEALANDIHMIQVGFLTRVFLAIDLSQGLHPLIELHGQSGGHAVIAYDLRDDGTGGFYIDVADSNLPYTDSSEGVGSAATHAADEELSTIHDSGSVWTYEGGFSRPWAGAAVGLAVQSPFVVPSHPTMPTTDTGFAAIFAPLGSAASVTQISDSLGHHLLTRDGGMNLDAQTRMPNAAILPPMGGIGHERPMYAVSVHGAYTQTLRGARRGTTGAALIGPGFAGEAQGLQTATGATEAVHADPSQGELDTTLSHGGNLRFDLIRGGAQHARVSAAVSVSGAGAGRQSLRLDSRVGALSYANNSRAVRIAVTLTGSSFAGGSSAALPAIAVPTHGRATFTAALPDDPAAGQVVITVRDRRAGMVLRRVIPPRARTRDILSVRLSVTKGRGANRSATAVVRFRVVPALTRVIVTMSARRGKRTLAAKIFRIAAHRARGRLTFTMPVPSARGAIIVAGGVAVISARPRMSIETMSASERVR